MKHTKGPWEKMGPIVRSKSGDICDCRCIWTRGGDPNMEVPLSEANAQLIAAAPELLEALEVALIGLLQVEDPLVETSDAIIAAKQAIAKADGNDK